MKTIKALMLMVPLAIQAIAQDSTPEPKFGVDFMFGMGCLCGIRNGDASKILQTNGLPALPQNMLSTHVGVGVVVKRFSVVTLFKGYAPYGTQENAAYGLIGGGTAFEGRLQYDGTSSDKFFIAPYAGVGIQRFGFMFDNNTSRDLNTAIQASANPYDVRRLNIGELYGSGGVSFGLTRNFYRVGLQAGYQFVTRAEWRLDDELLQTPSASFSGMEIKLSVGLLFSIKTKSRVVNSSKP